MEIIYRYIIFIVYWVLTTQSVSTLLHSWQFSIQPYNTGSQMDFYDILEKVLKVMSYIKYSTMKV